MQDPAVRWPMSAEELLALVRGEDRLGLGAALADELSLHLPPSESVHGRLCLEHGRATSHGFALAHSDVLAETWLFLTGRHLVRTALEQAQGSSGHPTVEVGSSPLGRLRGVKTRRESFGQWRLLLDISGPAFGAEYEAPISFHGKDSAPDAEARAFLTALAAVRR